MPAMLRGAPLLAATAPPATPFSARANKQDRIPVRQLDLQAEVVNSVFHAAYMDSDDNLNLADALGNVGNVNNNA